MTRTPRTPKTLNEVYDQLRRAFKVSDWIYTPQETICLARAIHFNLLQIPMLREFQITLAGDSRKNKYNFKFRIVGVLEDESPFVGEMKNSEN